MAGEFISKSFHSKYTRQAHQIDPEIGKQVEKNITWGYFQLLEDNSVHNFIFFGPGLGMERKKSTSTIPLNTPMIF